MEHKKYVYINCFILSVRLPVNSRLLGLKFWGVKSYTLFLTVWGICIPNPHVVQGSSAQLRRQTRHQEREKLPKLV